MLKVMVATCKVSVQREVSFVCTCRSVLCYSLSESVSGLANILVSPVTLFAFYKVDNITRAAIGMLSCIEASVVVCGKDSIFAGHRSTAFTAFDATSGGSTLKNGGPRQDNLRCRDWGVSCVF